MTSRCSAATSSTRSRSSRRSNSLGAGGSRSAPGSVADRTTMRPGPRRCWLGLPAEPADGEDQAAGLVGVFARVRVHGSLDELADGLGVHALDPLPVSSPGYPNRDEKGASWRRRSSDSRSACLAARGREHPSLSAAHVPSVPAPTFMADAEHDEQAEPVVVAQAHRDMDAVHRAGGSRPGDRDWSQGSDVPTENLVELRTIGAFCWRLVPTKLAANNLPTSKRGSAAEWRSLWVRIERRRL